VAPAAAGKNEEMATRADGQEAAQLARRILDAVERGELDADSPAARRLVRRLEGAAAAWEAEAVSSKRSVRKQSR
jgi:hypothetical protein